METPALLEQCFSFDFECSKISNLIKEQGQLNSLQEVLL